MKTCNRLTLPLGLALVFVLVGALLHRVRLAAPVALAEGEKQDSTRRRASSQGLPPKEPAALVEDEEEAPSQAQEKNVQPLPPEDEDWLNNMQNVPEEAKPAIAELERAGVRVLLYQHQGEEVHEEEDEDDEEEDDEEAPGEPIDITFRTPDATADKPGFQAGFTRKALGRLLRSLPNVGEIDLSGTNVSDDHLQELSGVATLTKLHLGNTPVTDKGLAHLAALRDLEALSLGNTQIGDAGMAHLRGMEKLESLGLVGTRITDAGLKNLEQMRNLQELILAHTNVSDAGLAHLAGLQLEALWLDATHVTDAGLIHLKGMTELEHLSLVDTKVTTAGIAQLRHLTKLQDQKVGDATYIGILLGSTIANNPATIEPATPKQIARLKEVLWWLPADSEIVCVAHGPVAFSFPSNEENLDNTVSFFQNYIRPSSYNVTDVEMGTLDQVPVALVVESRVAYAGCHVIVFERPLGEVGDSFMAAVGTRATKIELMGDTKVAQIDADIGKTRWTRFIARPAPDVLLFADNRDYLTDVLARMAKKAARRAFDDDLPEWKHLDLSARQWAMRHDKQTPNPTFLGLVYSVQAGDVAKVLYLSGNENALQVAKRSWSSLHLFEVRELEPNLIEISFSVGKVQALVNFFWTFFCKLWRGADCRPD